MLEAGDGFLLAVAHAEGVERVSEGHLGEASAESSGGIDPLGERLGAVEGEHAARARVGIALIAEEGFDAGGFVAEGERALVEASGEEVGQTGCVECGLVCDGGECDAFLFGFDDAYGPAIGEEEVVAAA